MGDGGLNYSFKVQGFKVQDQILVGWGKRGDTHRLNGDTVT